MHEFMQKLSRLFALLGGIVLTVLIVIVCLSILGRLLNSVLNGDLMQQALPGVANYLLALGVGRWALGRSRVISSCSRRVWRLPYSRSCRSVT